MFGFFRSAFLAFRDRRAHEFVNTDADEAFDLIVLANRLLLIIEQGQQQSQTQLASPDFSYDRVSSLLRAYLSVPENAEYGPKPVFLDADNDGEPELLIPGGLLTSNRERGEAFRVFKNVGETNQQIGVEEGDYSFPAHDILLADVDNDGHHEVVCTTRVGVGYNNVLLVYKYRNGRYEVLKKDPQAATGIHEGFAFFNAHVGDINDDGQTEVVSEPKLSGALPPPVRYVWKWSQEEGVFKFLYEEELTYDWLPRST
jgi:FG-GAP-like repeat